MNSGKTCKIGFIHPDLGIGGAERLVLDVADALGSKGHQSVFITNHFDETHAFDELKCNKYPVCVIGDWIPRSICGICQAIFAYIRMVYLIIKYLIVTNKEEKPDIYFVDQIPIAIPFIKWSGKKVVYYCHHPDLLASPCGGFLKSLYRLPINWLEWKGTSFADVLLVNSQYTASVFQKTFPDIRTDVQVLYPTISCSYQSKIESRTPQTINKLLLDLGTSSDGVIFLSINRYHPAKNLELALYALNELKQQVSSDNWGRVHFVMAGGYDSKSSINRKYFSKLISMAASKGLSSKVTFLKSPSDDLKADLLLACDCLIYTPVNEHFGIVPLEAMIASKPVIACNSGGPCETVENEVTGYLCAPIPYRLAQCMSKMFDKNHSKEMGRLGRARQEKYFSRDTFTRNINKAIDDLVMRYEGNEFERIKHKTNEKSEPQAAIEPVISLRGNAGDANSERTRVSIALLIQASPDTLAAAGTSDTAPKTDTALKTDTSLKTDTAVQTDTAVKADTIELAKIPEVGEVVRL